MHVTLTLCCAPAVCVCLFLCVSVLQDVTWNLQVQKTGTDTVYQGAVTGQVTITNPQATPVTVYNINDYVQGGPSATVSCGTQLPFQVCVHGWCLVCSRHACRSSNSPALPQL